VLLGPARPLSRLHRLAALIATRRIVLLLPTGATALPALPLPALLRLICHLGRSFPYPAKLPSVTGIAFSNR
jgi:hypothetical protein